MVIKRIKLKGYRNFKLSHINFRDKTLIIGANDVGKTNLLYAIRILLDKSFSDSDIEPVESDFHIGKNGEQSATLEITIQLSNIIEDAVLSKLKGAVSDKGETVLKYIASRSDLSYQIFIGHDVASLEEIETRHYLKHIHLRYMQSSRDLNYYIRKEKHQLVRLSKETRDEKAKKSDNTKEVSIQKGLSRLNHEVGKLNYIATATSTLNAELKKLSHHYSDYTVNFESTSIDFSTFIDQLSIGARTGDKSVGLGGDGRNNQILIALWKAKSEREHDLGSEAIIYCIEEPEAHLHPHQQKKLVKYLIEELGGQVFVTTHSPQIVAGFSPDSITRLYEKDGKTLAASRGCADCIEEAWRDMGYRMSILPAEAFFADVVLLVEGPSEIQFYHELAKQLEIDLDYFNISILSIDGAYFRVYVKILDAMQIPWVLRTDNDVTKVPRSIPAKWRLSGLNRALSLSLSGEPGYEDSSEEIYAVELKEAWAETSTQVNPEGIFIAKIDLEHDLGECCSESFKEFAGTDDLDEAVKYLQGRKAIRMGEYLAKYPETLKGLKGDELAKPLFFAIKKATERRDAGIGSKK